MRTPKEGLRNAAMLPHPLRDYTWLQLPGRAGATDMDFVVERKGNFFMMEQKQGGAIIPTGQAIMLHQLRKQGWHVIVARTTDMPNEYRVARWSEYGEDTLGIMTSETLNGYVNNWFQYADAHKK